MKVAYITGTYPCISESFIAREISALSRRGFEISVFSLTGSGSALADQGPHASIIYRPSLFSWAVIRDLAEILLRTPMRVIRAFSHALRNRPAQAGVFKLVRHFLTAISFSRAAARTGVEHIHAHFAFITADIASAMGDMLDMRYTLSVHAWDLYAQSDDSIAKRVRGAAKVLACTQHGRERVMAAAPGISQELVTVMRHGLEPDSWDAGSNEKSRTILSVGRLVAKKGFLTLIAACKTLRDNGTQFSCTIVGEGPERGRIELAVKKAELSGQVTLKGELTGTALQDEFRQAALFALPSVVGEDGDRDGLPNTVLEAMAAKLPVVVTTASAAPEIIQHGTQGYVVASGDADELAESISSLLADPALRKSMGNFGRELVKNDFDVDKNTAMIAEVFSACISERRAKRDR